MNINQRDMGLDEYTYTHEKMSQREDVALRDVHGDPTIVLRCLVEVGPSTSQCMRMGRGAHWGNAKINQASSSIRINQDVGLSI
jgi:hypothetical protein